MSSSSPVKTPKRQIIEVGILNTGHAPKGMSSMNKRWLS